MADQLPVFPATGPLLKVNEEQIERGRRPVIFDILGPDRKTSLLPSNLRLVLQVNPRQMSLSYGKQTDRVQTRGGFVEFHWGDAAEEITFSAATGGFMRMYTGLSNITGADGGGVQGRRETIAYDKYLDLLALFHNNGSIYDAFGNIVMQGYLKLTFDGGVHIGWFDGNFSVTETAEKPYMFEMNARFIIDREIMSFSTANLTAPPSAVVPGGVDPQPEGQTSTEQLSGLGSPFIGIGGQRGVEERLLLEGDGGFGFGFGFGGDELP